MTLLVSNGAVLKSFSQKQLKEFRKLNNSGHELFSKSFQLPSTGTFKNCTITYPQSHRKCHILRWYEWDLLVFCK